MAEKGEVIELKDNLAVIKLIRTEACGKCKACLAGITGQEMRIEAENLCGAKKGDWVEMELIENGYFYAVMIMYGIPCLAFLAGLLSSYYILMPKFVPFTSPDLPSFAFGLVCTCLAYLWIKSQEPRWRSKKYRPIAVRITTPEV